MLKENDSLVQVKICGLTSMDDVHIIEKYGADYAGMVLYYPKSKRNIDINLAAVLVAQLKKSDIKSVAVVVSPDVSQLEAIQNAGFDYIQIHGEVPDEVLQAANLKIWKAFNVTDLSEFSISQKKIYIWRLSDGEVWIKYMDCFLMREFRGAVRHSTGKVLKKRTAVIRNYSLQEDLHQTM